MLTLIAKSLSFSQGGSIVHQGLNWHTVQFAIETIETTVRKTAKKTIIAVATTVRTGTFLWARGARPQKCPKSNGSSYQQFITAVCIAILLFVAPVGMGVAQADDSISTATQEFLETVNEARANFDTFSRESKDLLSQGIRESQALLKDLPTKLEKFAAETDVTARDALRREIVEKQQSLAELTNSFDTRIAAAEQAEKQYKTAIDDAYDLFKKSISQTQDGLKTETHEKVASLKQSLKETAKAISGVSNGTSRIATGKVPFTPTQFDEQFSSLNAVFEKASNAIQSLVE
jgi:hypothetical protein